MKEVVKLLFFVLIRFWVLSCVVNLNMKHVKIVYDALLQKCFVYLCVCPFSQSSVCILYSMGLPVWHFRSLHDAPVHSAG